MTWQTDLAAKVKARREASRLALSAQAEAAYKEYTEAGRYVRGVVPRPLFPGEDSDEPGFRGDATAAGLAEGGS